MTTPPHAAPAPFGARLRRAMDTYGPLCVGIDPHPSLLADWGLGDDVAGLTAFTRASVDALAGRVASVKPQSAFFERFGSRGLAVLEGAVAELRAAGTLVIMDAKRGDIGSTMTAYAQTYLSPDAPLFSDALTVSPYLGYGSLAPAVELARRNGGGLFVLALTSNAEGAEVQHAVRPDGRTVGATMLAHLARDNEGATPMGSFGAVVGATLGDLSSYDLRIGGPLLAPGIGAQGATAADLPKVFGPAASLVVPNVSRGVLRHGPDVAALRGAAERFADEIRAAVG
ncbi:MULTISPECIES: orotidine-5'-phosphate decarboxylase [Streptomyces diastaticus group]|uniref:Orotidine 5'-phosphate decarboxylase n=3 Tax=Streptomyces diastaticus group TaxID=2849069 RepID=A0A8H9LTW8_9ACTN|nr:MULTISPECIES: orotidine-5'-phosphate decarboxylase [Streptomyces diastaticus group]QNE80278.1 orotidine-5'-phosphate decarboxylase [Streptomyces rutgersensis]GFH72082.1 orotidine 5'-phosphate decarboxylase [Streptomyces diastaticus subsp. diastaticus]GFH80879.1 orotidine 5'-phosphate decarboxylase [Streptomyces gougerotii]GGU30130.1 orotidine 5'-phosphate decarboxylase [Streptomyces diastaticus subsp. diastaticus]GGU79345.1 orotidine 5'-phosphate decarboxylase [Streptomyces gougerotii]